MYICMYVCMCVCVYVCLCLSVCVHETINYFILFYLFYLFYLFVLFYFWSYILCRKNAKTVAYFDTQKHINIFFSLLLHLNNNLLLYYFILLFYWNAILGICPISWVPSRPEARYLTSSKAAINCAMTRPYESTQATFFFGGGGWSWCYSWIISFTDTRLKTRVTSKVRTMKYLPCLRGKYMAGKWINNIEVRSAAGSRECISVIMKLASRTWYHTNPPGGGGGTSILKVSGTCRWQGYDFCSHWY